MRVQPYLSSPPPRPGRPQTSGDQKPTDHTLPDGLQLGHNASSVGEASGILRDVTRDEMLEMRGIVAREGRQTAILGESSRPHTVLRGGAIGLNGLVAVGAVWHGIELLQSEHGVHRAEGVNHLLMGVGCGLTAIHLSNGSPALGHLAGQFLIANGLGEIGVGIYRAAHSEKTLGLLQAGHGACLIGAEMIPGAALPLCVAMATLTGVQIWQHHSMGNKQGD